MLVAYETVRSEHASVDARLMLASSLDDGTRAWALRAAAKANVEVFNVEARSGLSYPLPAFDAALCASGTASLECVLAGVVPVVCYRVGALTELGVRAFVDTKHVALPNILIGRSAFPELLQRDATPERMTDALLNVLEHRAPFLAAVKEVELALGPKREAATNVARMLEPWLTRSAA
jgi:lipid-A-disaccharide synthase